MTISPEYPRLSLPLMDEGRRCWGSLKGRRGLDVFCIHTVAVLAQKEVLKELVGNCASFKCNTTKNRRAFWKRVGIETR